MATQSLEIIHKTHDGENAVPTDEAEVAAQEEDSSWVINKDKTKEQFRNYEENPRQKRVREFYRLQHTNQTYDYVMNKRKEHLQFNKCVMTVWDMLHYLNNVVDDSDPDTNLSQLEHAIQTGEAARAMYPDEDKWDWLHVVAVIHDLGKILAVTDKELCLVGDPQWAVVGDNFPVGCAFSEKNIYHEYFKDNPDSSNPKYNTKYGIYSPHCGLNNITMSWGHDEYMYQICKTQSTLPASGMHMIRFHSFYPWHKENGYKHLMNGMEDEAMLKDVRLFNTFDLYSKSTECAKFEDVAPYYKAKIEKYFPKPVRW